jgi:hypothetical protein
MRTLSLVLLAICTAMILGLACPQAKASRWDKKTIVKFNEPVEIPGRVLSPGTYIFSMNQTLSDRHLVQIWSGNGEHLITTVATYPIERPRPAPVTILTLEKQGSHSPEALRDWFYPGDFQGQQFVYSAANSPQNTVLGK